jgi:hypothetical protein
MRTKDVQNLKHSYTEYRKVPSENVRGEINIGIRCARGEVIDHEGLGVTIMNEL